MIRTSYHVSRVEFDETEVVITLNPPRDIILAFVARLTANNGCITTVESNAQEKHDLEHSSWLEVTE